MKERLNNKLKRFVVLPILFISLASTILINCKGPSAKTSAHLKNGFLNPPESARPRQWWHWMNGNITKEGIKADLEWMKRVGIGGFQNFDAAISTPQIVEKRLQYMTPEWKDAFLFTTKLADSLDLEMSIAGSPGWSESGGPWERDSFRGWPTLYGYSSQTTNYNWRISEYWKTRGNLND
jgi:hypothetical protein